MLIQSLALSFLPIVASVPASDAAPNDEWLDLDSEIELLADNASLPGVPVAITARLIGSYVYSSEPEFFYGSGTGDDDVSGVHIRSARLRFDGGNDRWRWQLSADAGDNDLLTGGALRLKNATLTRRLSESTDLTVGQFKHPITQAGMLSSKYRMFFDRDNNGQQTNDRELGIKLVGDYGKFHAFLAMMNSQDGVADNAVLSARIEYDLMGEPFDMYEGAWGAPEGTHFGFAFAGVDDGTVTDGVYGVAEGELTTGGFYAGASLVSYDENYDEVGGISQDQDLGEILGTSLADTSPFTATTALLWGGSRYEIAGRIEVFDDENNTSRTGVSFSIYDEELGPHSRILIDYSDVTSDDESIEGDKIEIGFIYVVGN
jgi:hypothetical protein